MRKLKVISILILLTQHSIYAHASEIKPEEVLSIMKRVADWQIAHFDDTYSGRGNPHHDLFWGNATFYLGLTKLAAMTDDESYYQWLKDVGEKNAWNLHERTYHADDHAVGQMYMQMYRRYEAEAMIKPMIDQFQFILYHPAISSLSWQTPFHQDRWNWCDALFMSPPVWAMLYNHTGEKDYLDFMVKEYQATTDFLFDTEEHLYYRDERFKTQLDNGTKVFWSRGNGWVFAGLVNIMKELNPESEAYQYFLSIYTKMAARIHELQTPQGHWAMSLLGQELYPTPETSGTAFFTYGFAWGINNGVLDKGKYLPSVIKAWNSLVSHVTGDGMLGYVQPIGAAPGNAWPDKTEFYGSGAFLSAGSEVYKLVGGTELFK